MKKYDDRYKSGVCPFTKERWWYLDPNCKPKRGDWVGFWIALKNKLSYEELNSILREISTIEDEFKDYIKVYTVEYDGYFPYLSIIVGFKRDSDKTLHEWMFDVFCKVFNSECGKPYNSRKYVEWVNYMGIDDDFAIFDVKVSTKRAKINDKIRLTVTNYGRASGSLTVYAMENKSGVMRFMKGCTVLSIPPNTTRVYDCSVEVNEVADFWSLLWSEYACLKCSEVPPTSKNVLVINEVHEQPHEPPSTPTQPTTPTPPTIPTEIYGIPTWMLVGGGIVVLIGLWAYYEEKKREELIMLLKRRR